MEVFVAFLEATATAFPSLQEVFDYSNEAMTNSASESFLLTTSFRKLLSNMNQNPDHTFELIKGAEVLNTEFEYQSAEQHSEDNTGTSDTAHSLLDQFGEPDGDDGGHGNGNRPEARIEGETGLQQDENKDATSGDERDNKSASPEEGRMADDNTEDDPDDDDDDDRLDEDDEDEDEGYEQENLAKRQKIGSLFFRAGRLN